jgi:hypothetical protein
VAAVARREPGTVKEPETVNRKGLQVTKGLKALNKIGGLIGPCQAAGGML